MSSVGTTETIMDLIQEERGMPESADDKLETLSPGSVRLHHNKQDFYYLYFQKTDAFILSMNHCYHKH